MFRETYESDSPAIRNMPFADGVISAGQDGSFLGAYDRPPCPSGNESRCYAESVVAFSERLKR